MTGIVVPLAAGAKIGRPEAPVLAFVGDAGLEMGAGELATLAARNLPIIICVLVDHSLSLIEMKQRGSQRPNLGVDFGGADADMGSAIDAFILRKWGGDERRNADGTRFCPLHLLNSRCVFGVVVCDHLHPRGDFELLGLWPHG